MPSGAVPDLKKRLWSHPSHPIISQVQRGITDILVKVTLSSYQEKQMLLFKEITLVLLFIRGAITRLKKHHIYIFLLAHDNL